MVICSQNEQTNKFFGVNLGKLPNFGSNNIEDVGDSPVEVDEAGRRRVYSLAI